MYANLQKVKFPEWYPTSCAVFFLHCSFLFHVYVTKHDQRKATRNITPRSLLCSMCTTSLIDNKS